MNFNIITIRSETEGTLVMTPEHLYQISDHDIKYVVMYNLKFMNSGQIIEANIPYYISNGATNKLRANMLYPFMCYSSIIEASFCPYDVARRSNSNPYTGILLKYNSLGNINIQKLEEDLLHTFFGIYSDLEEEKSIMSNKIGNRYEQGNDLISVLQRITNFLDFIICIVNDVIAVFDYSSSETRIDIDNGKYRPLSREQKAIEDYTDLSIFGRETIYNISQHKTDNSSSSFNNHFRLVILTILNKYYKLLVDNSIIDIEQIVLQHEIITVNEFNSIVNICDKLAAGQNMINYRIVSNKIIDVIIEKIDLSQKMPEQSKIILKSLIIRTTKTLVEDDEIYDHLLKNWNSHCLGKGILLERSNIYAMNYVEICEELSKYSDFITTIPGLSEQINRGCNNELCKTDPLCLKYVRDKLLMVRSLIIQYNYIGQYKIKYKISDGTEKFNKVDIDSSETILNLKSKIYSLEGIDPSNQELSYTSPFGGNIIHLENDRTIASYKIPNYSILNLIIR